MVDNGKHKNLLYLLMILLPLRGNQKQQSQMKFNCGESACETAVIPATSDITPLNAP